jgi:C4-dicarboxylate transporter, DctQ subunit
MKIDRTIELFEEAVSIFTLAAIVTLVLVQVYYRYVLSSGILWIDELVINLMILLVMVGAGLATRNGAHIDLTMFQESAGTNVRFVLKLLSAIVTITFLCILVYASSKYAYNSRRLSTTMIGIPLWLAYGTIPLGGALMLYEFVRHYIKMFGDGEFFSNGVDQ